MDRHSGEASRIVGLQCSVLTLDRYTVFLRVHLTDSRVFSCFDLQGFASARVANHVPGLVFVQPTGDLLPSSPDATPEPEVCAHLCSSLRDSAFRDGSANSIRAGIYRRARLRVFPPGFVHTIGQLSRT